MKWLRICAERHRFGCIPKKLKIVETRASAKRKTKHAGRREERYRSRTHLTEKRVNGYRRVFH